MRPASSERGPRRSLRDVRQAVGDSFTRISENVLLHSPGMQPLRKQLLADALRYYQRFAERSKNRPELQADLAAASMKMGEITADIGSNQEAMGYFAEAQRLYENLARSRPADTQMQRELAAVAGLGQVLLASGQRREAKDDFVRAISIQRALLTVPPGGTGDQNSLAGYLSGLAETLHELGSPGEARDAARRPWQSGTGW